MCKVNRIRRCGSVFILVLIVTAGATGLVMAMLYRTRLEMRTAADYAEKVRAEYLAIGGVERLRAVLGDSERLVTGAGFFGDAGQERLLGEEDNFELVYSLRDELSYFNVNESDPKVWEKMGIIEEGQLACLLDWIDEDREESAGGAEEEYYERLEEPLKCKNGRIDLLRELLWIKGVGTKKYFDTSSFFEGSSPSSDQTDPESKILQKQRGLFDFFTVCGEGRFNINSVSEEFMAALPGVDEAAAYCVASYRKGDDGIWGTEDDFNFADANGLGEVEGLGELAVELLGQYCCFGSEYFRGISLANAGVVRCAIAVTFRNLEGDVEIVNMERLL